MCVLFSYENYVIEIFQYYAANITKVLQFSNTPNYNNYNNYSENGHPLSVPGGSILYIFNYKYIKIEFHVQPFRGSRIACAYFGCNYCNYCNR